MTKKFVLCWFVVLLCLFAAPFLAAQTSTTLYGTVTDRSGAVVPGAQVMAKNLGTNLTRTAQTNAEGQYHLEFLPIGSYSVEVTATGFKKFVQKGIALDVTPSAARCSRATSCRRAASTPPRRTS